MEYLETIEKTLDEILPGAGVRPAPLSEAMRYAVGTGGKRIRPLICLASAVAVGGRAEDARHPAAAIELLHNYTLVHDDLPAMDNDVERRGKPTVWKRFGEANAILAGDSLQALAFAAAARAPRNVPQIVATLGRYGLGVVQGQVEDVDDPASRSPGALAERNPSALAERNPSALAERNPSALARDVGYIYEHKTGDLFCAAAVMGGYAGGGDERMIGRLRSFALNLGLAFQFEDDLLDGDSPYGGEETKERIARHTAAAIAALDGLPGDTSFLKALADKLANRKA